MRDETLRRVDRRQWLIASGAAWASAAAYSTCASADDSADNASGAEATGIEFGYSLYGMRKSPLAEALNTTAKLGYDAVELASLPDWPADPKRLTSADRSQLRTQLGDLGLSLPALMENLGLGVDERAQQAQLDRLKAVCELAQELALAKQPRPLVETVVGGKPGEWATVKGRFAERLVQWARVAEQMQTVVVIKPHRMGALNLPADAVWLLEQAKSPWIKLGYDYSHFAHRDMPLVETLRTMIPHTAFIHVKDTVIENGKARFVLPGDGDIDYPTLLHEAKSLGYRGCVCVEVSGMVQGRPDYDAIAAARHSYENLAPAFAKSGIARGRVR